MVPEKTKPKRNYIPPSFIDEETIKNLPEEKQLYWANRIRGHPGQGKKHKKVIYRDPEGSITRFDNEGNVVVNNRASRRRSEPTDPSFTKATHSLRKSRKNK